MLWILDSDAFLSLERNVARKNGEAPMGAVSERETRAHGAKVSLARPHRHGRELDARTEQLNAARITAFPNNRPEGNHDASATHNDPPIP